MTLSQTNPAPQLAGTALEQIDAWWRAANYLAVGMIYLQDNPLLSEPLELLGRQGAADGVGVAHRHGVVTYRLWAERSRGHRR